MFFEFVYLFFSDLLRYNIMPADSSTVHIDQFHAFYKEILYNFTWCTVNKVSKTNIKQKNIKQKASFKNISFLH